MSIPELPEDIEHSALNDCANSLHSMCIRLLRRARESDKSSGLTPERLSILSILAFTGARTVNELAEMEQVSAPAISRITKALAELQLIIRGRDKKDARVVYLKITNKGKEMIESVRRKRILRIADELKAIPESQLIELSNLTKQLA